MTDDKRILKHIMIDILNLRNGMEDNLLLIQQINLMIQKEGEEQKGFDDVIHVAQQHIDSINTVYTLGVSWLKDETEFALKFIEGKNLRGIYFLEYTKFNVFLQFFVLLNRNIKITEVFLICLMKVIITKEIKSGFWDFFANASTKPLKFHKK